MQVLGEQLEAAGDELPTFDSTYQDYKLELEMWEIAGKKMTEHIRSICSIVGSDEETRSRAILQKCWIDMLENLTTSWTKNYSLHSDYHEHTRNTGDLSRSS